MLSQTIDATSVAIEAESEQEQAMLERALRRAGIQPLPSEVVSLRLHRTDWQSLQPHLAVERLMATAVSLEREQPPPLRQPARHPARAAR